MLIIHISTDLSTEGNIFKKRSQWPVVSAPDFFCNKKKARLPIARFWRIIWKWEFSILPFLSLVCICYVIPISILNGANKEYSRYTLYRILCSYKLQYPTRSEHPLKYINWKKLVGSQG
jgi:hypothetical protein